MDVTAKSVNPADVIAAANEAGPEGRIFIPPGKGVYGPGSTSGMQYSYQEFICSGVGRTIFETHDAQNLFHHPKRFANFSVEMHNTTEFINTGAQGFEITDVHVKSFTGGGALFARAVQQNDKAGPPVEGLFRNMLMENCRIVGNGAGFDTATNGSGGTPYWQLPSPIGKQSGVVVVEDCDIRYDAPTGSWQLSALDSNNGFMLCVRKTKFKNTLIEAHSVQGDHRATRSTEVYDCTFDADVVMPTCMYIRAGTLVAYNNRVSPNFNEFVAMDNIRSWDTAFLTRAPMYACNGESPWDGNEPGEMGWPARDQIGRGRDLGPFPSKQESEPCYLWNNTRFDGTPFNRVVVWNAFDGVKPGGSGADIKEGREYFFMPRPNYAPLIYPHPWATNSPIPPDPPEPEPPPNQAPAIRFVKPAGTGPSNEIITDGKQIAVKTQNIALEASDDTGPEKIELYIDGELKKANINGEKTLTYSWNTAPYKKREVNIEGFTEDAAGLRTSTGIKRVKVVW